MALFHFRGRVITETTAIVAVILTLSSAAASQTRKNSPTQPLTILFHSDPEASGFHKEPKPLKAGPNKFEVLVKDASGKEVDDADVALTLRMPANPRTKMAEMTNTIPLKHYGAGIYRGEGDVAMAGTWSATIVVKHDGREIGTRKLDLIAQ